MILADVGLWVMFGPLVVMGLLVLVASERRGVGTHPIGKASPYPPRPTPPAPARRTIVAATVNEQLDIVERHLELATEHLTRRDSVLLTPSQQQALLAINELAIAIGYLTTAVCCLHDPDCRKLEGIDRG